MFLLLSLFPFATREATLGDTMNTQTPRKWLNLAWQPSPTAGYSSRCPLSPTTPSPLQVCVQTQQWRVPPIKSQDERSARDLEGGWAPLVFQRQIVKEQCGFCAACKLTLSSFREGDMVECSTLMWTWVGFSFLP